MGLQALLHMAYPPQCITCGARVTSDFGLCGDCWRETPFIAGLVCNHCGIPLPGEEADAPVLCDDCLTIARPWRAGRAALLYHENGRKLVLALKHADRLDLAHPAAEWMFRPPNLCFPPICWWSPCRCIGGAWCSGATIKRRFCQAASQNSHSSPIAPTCCNARTAPDRKRAAIARGALPICRAL